MKLVNLIEEDFTNYREPGMFLGFPYCTGKCNPTDDLPVCQNQRLHSAKLIDISSANIIKRYSYNPISKCMIVGGMEPFDSFDELWDLYRTFNDPSRIPESYRGPFISKNDPFIIYTGYYPFEIKNDLAAFASCMDNNPVIIKFGRYIPGHKPHFDVLLGVDLASDNQYAQCINLEWWENTFGIDIL